MEARRFWSKASATGSSAVASTHAEAIALMKNKKPGTDPLRHPARRRQLGALDAVNELLRSHEVSGDFHHRFFPERFLTGERPEPAFLIAKAPSNPRWCRAIASQALFFGARRQAARERPIPALDGFAPPAPGRSAPKFTEHTVRTDVGLPGLGGIARTGRCVLILLISSASLVAAFAALLLCGHAGASGHHGRAQAPTPALSASPPQTITNTVNRASQG